TAIEGVEGFLVPADGAIGAAQPEMGVAQLVALETRGDRLHVVGHGLMLEAFAVVGTGDQVVEPGVVRRPLQLGEEPVEIRRRHRDRSGTARSPACGSRWSPHRCRRSRGWPCDGTRDTPG